MVAAVIASAAMRRRNAQGDKTVGEDGPPPAWAGGTAALDSEPAAVDNGLVAAETPTAGPAVPPETAPTAAALQAEQTAAVVAAAAAVAAPAASYALPAGELQAIALAAGLQWVASDADKVAAVQAAMAAEPQPIHVPRAPRPPVVIDEGPLVLVETRLQLSQLKLPFEQQTPAT